MEGDSRNPRVSLLKKYDIPVDHLSYEYVGQCSNKKELERIVRILRSGEEGIYPDLIKVAEDKLKKLAPNSRVLRSEAPILTKESLSEEEWKKVEGELLSWENEMKVMDQSLEFEKKRLDVIGNKNLPDVRKVEPVKSKVEKTKVKIDTDNKNNRIKSGDYKSWDKFDVDKELLKLDLDEERKAEECAKKKRELEKKKKEQKNIEIVNPDAAVNYTNTEQLVLANQAKDRGNECFKSGDLNNALKYYGVSIKLCPTANAYNNRAMTYIKLKNYENALTDCNEVLKLEPSNVKALHRRATAYQNLPDKGYNDLALKDLSRIISLEPNNKVAQTDLQALKKKLKIEDNGRRFRMAIQETDDSKYTGKKPADWNFPGSNIPVDRLPLTYYGPSTSTFECEPHSMAHKILLGPSFTGRVMCKCNSNTPRQNPLCQRCGELMSRPKPVVKKSKVESVKDKTDNNKKNELLKQNQKTELPKEGQETDSNKKSELLKQTQEKVESPKKAEETVSNKKNELLEEVQEKAELLKKVEETDSNKKNELLKGVEEKAELPKEAQEVDKKMESFIQNPEKTEKPEEVQPVKENPKDTKKDVNDINEKSKFKEGAEDIKKPNAKFKEDWDNFINSKFNNANKAKTKFVNNTVDDGRTAFITEIFDDEDFEKDEKIPIEEEIVKENKKEEKNIENECKLFPVDDDKETKEKLPGSEEKLPELEKKVQDIEENLPELEDDNSLESEEKLEKPPHTIDSSDNQSLPSTSSQSEPRKSKTKRKRRERSSREYKYSYLEPVKVQQASKYVKPTSVEPKMNGESTREIHHEIITDSNVQFKSFVPNRKCVSTEDVLKANRTENIHRDNRFELMNGDGEKIQNEISEEGNKENIEKCNDGGGEEVRVAKKIESAYEFIKEWESLKKSDETYAKRAEIMKLLRPSDLGKVIGNKLDSEILKNMLECLERHFIETDPKTTVEFLKQLLNVPRFGIVKLFMDNYEKKIIERLVDSAEKKGYMLDQEIKKQLTSG